jgi:hypothetical protein
MKETFLAVRPALVAMKVGDSLEFSIKKLKSVRTQASELGAIMDRRYATRMDRFEGTVKVIRVE